MLLAVSEETEAGEMEAEEMGAGQTPVHWSLVPSTQMKPNAPPKARFGFIDRLERLLATSAAIRTKSGSCFTVSRMPVSHVRIVGDTHAGRRMAAHRRP